MGNYSDGDREDHKGVKAVMEGKPAGTSESENVSHNMFQTILLTIPRFH